MVPTPGVLAFSDKPLSMGRYPVTTSDGMPLAVIERSPGSRSFKAVAPDGSTLCSGTPRRLQRRYELSDGAGRPLLTLRSPAVSVRRTTARLADGSRLAIKAQLRSGTVTVTDRSREPVLTIERARGRLHPDDVVVQVANPSLGLPLVIAVVYGYLCDSHRTTVWDVLFNN